MPGHPPRESRQGDEPTVKRRPEKPDARLFSKTDVGPIVDLTAGQRSQRHGAEPEPMIEERDHRHQGLSGTDVDGEAVRKQPLDEVRIDGPGDEAKVVEVRRGVCPSRRRSLSALHLLLGDRRDPGASSAMGALCILAAAKAVWTDRCHQWRETERLPALAALIVVSARGVSLHNQLHNKGEGDDDYRNEHVSHRASFERADLGTAWPRLQGGWRRAGVTP